MTGLALEKTWHKALAKEIRKDYIQELRQFLSDEKKQGHTFFPPEPLVFNAFRLTPYSEVKVVIMGQDPYHGPNQAEGLSFSVPKDVPVPPSLKNIYKELKEDLQIEPPKGGNLSGWARQGVLMLNATLTVRARQPKSHYGKGWEVFTDKVVEKLCEKTDPIVFILWGRSAKEKCEKILNTKEHPHAVLTSAHPSPYSVDGFFGCRHFSKANNYLKEWGKTPIDWSSNS